MTKKLCTAAFAAACFLTAATPATAFATDNTPTKSGSSKTDGGYDFFTEFGKAFIGDYLGHSVRDAYRFGPMSKEAVTKCKETAPAPENLPPNILAPCPTAGQVTFFQWLGSIMLSWISFSSSPLQEYVGSAQIFGGSSKK